MDKLRRVPYLNQFPISNGINVIEKCEILVSVCTKAKEYHPKFKKIIDEVISLINDLRSLILRISNRINFYWNEYKRLRYLLNAIGGLMQIAVGIGLCSTWAGAVAGVPMIAHGINNAYEGGVSFLNNGSAAVGPVRKFYGYVAEQLGGTKEMGSAVYSLVDIGMAVGAMTRLVPIEGKFSLWYPDKIMAFRQAAIGPLFIDIQAQVANIQSFNESLDEIQREENRGKCAREEVWYERR